MPDAKETKWTWDYLGSGLMLFDASGRRVVLAARRAGQQANGTLLTCGDDGVLVALDPESRIARLLKEAPEMFAAIEECLRVVTDEEHIYDGTAPIDGMREVVARINAPAESEKPGAC